ncbi:MAG: acylase [Pseudomonadota bacterium]
MVWIKRGGWTLLVVVIAGFAALATWEPFFAEQSYRPSGTEKRTYRAEIIRNEYGVPHIYGDTDADVAFGVAIAQSEDDFFTMQDVVAMSRGRYGAIAGQDGATFDYVYHLLDARGTAERHYDNLPADTRALFEAFASGLNTYAADHPGEIKLARLFPVAGIDVAAGFALRQPFFFGLGNVIGPLVEGSDLPREFGPDIPGFPREVSLYADESGESEQANLLHPLPIGEDAALLGSNAFAVTPEKSGGPTTLVSNSHQPLRGGVAWYEMVVESGEGWHFAGANFPGSPFPFLGHNRHLGWTNTVNRPDMADIYELEMNAEGTQYRLDGEWRDLERKTVTLPVKLGPLTLPIRREVLRSAHGPVIQNDKGHFAIRYGGIDNIDQLDAYYRINKATSLEEWQNQIARMAIPSTNFIYADETGNIAYVYNAAIPDRPELEEVQANWRGILPGNRSDLIWEGAVGYDEIPKVINPGSGWVYNSNNEPYTAAGAGDDVDPAEFSPVLGVERKQTNRSRRAYKLLSEAGVLDRATLEAIKYDTGYERAGYIDMMFDELEALEFPPRMKDGGATGGRIRQARDLLLTWDFTADSKGAADALAYLIIRDFMSAEYQNKPWPNVRNKLNEAAGHLMKHFGRLDPPMSELIRLRQGDRDLPLDGGSDTLRAATTWKVDDDGRLSLVHGDSFIQWVEWPSDGGRVSSRSIQPFGAAITRPESPHYTDQMQLFVDHRLKPVHFWREDVMANAKRRYVVESY